MAASTTRSAGTQAIVEDLATQYAIRADELDPSVAVRSERDLVRSVLAFVRDGVGGERFVASSDIVEAFAARFTRRITLGGTGVRAAVAMSRLGVREHRAPGEHRRQRALAAASTRCPTCAAPCEDSPTRT